MSNANNDDSDGAAPPENQYMPLISRPAVNASGGSAHSTPAGLQPHPWRVQYRADSPHPHYISIPLRASPFGYPDTDELTGRTEGYATGSDIDTDSQESLPSDNGDVSSMFGSPEWDRVTGQRYIGYHQSDDGQGPQISTRSPPELFDGTRPLNRAPGESSRPIVSTSSGSPDLTNVRYHPRRERNVDDVLQASNQAPSGPSGSGNVSPPLQRDRTTGSNPQLTDQSMQAEPSDSTNPPPAQQPDQTAGDAQLPSSQPMRSEPSGSAGELPPLQREASRATNVSTYTDIETPDHPSASLPEGPLMSLAQQVWAHGKIRKRIMSYMDGATITTMCRVNRRMYTQAVSLLMFSIDFHTLVRAIQAVPIKYGWRTVRLARSVKELIILPDMGVLTWSDFCDLCPSLRTVIFAMASPERDLWTATTLHKPTRTSRYGRRTIIICHAACRDIDTLLGSPELPAPIDITPDHLIIHRYEYAPDIPDLNMYPKSRLTEFSPLGDHISGITSRNPTSFSFAYEQLKQCVDKRRCPRVFIWSHVHLRVWRITIGELRLVLELLQANHLEVGELRIYTEFRDQGTVSIQEFVEAGPCFWRLLGKFKHVALEFRLENEPLPMPGKGPKGLSAFGKNEPLNLTSLMVAAAVPSNGPLDIWKFNFKYIYSAFFKALMVPTATYLNAVHAESEQNPDPERERLYNTAVVAPIWDLFRRSVKSQTTFSFMWEWEHGSVAPVYKAPPPGWRKIKVKATDVKGK